MNWLKRTVLSVTAIGLVYIGNVQYQYWTAQPTDLARVVIESLEEHPEHWQIVTKEYIKNVELGIALENINARVYTNSFGKLQVNDLITNISLREYFTCADLRHIDHHAYIVAHKLGTTVIRNKVKQRLDSLVGNK